MSALGAARTLSPNDASIIYQYACLAAETEALVKHQQSTAALIEQLKELLKTLPAEQRAAAIAEVAKLTALAARYPSMIRQQRAAVRMFLVELGLTPASRSRVTQLERSTAVPAAPTDAFTRLYQQATAFHVRRNKGTRGKPHDGDSA